MAKKKKQVKDVEAEEKVTKTKKNKIEETKIEEEIEEFDSEEVELEEKSSEEVEKKDKKEKQEKKKSKKEGFFGKISRELKKVVWPSAGAVAKYSIAVIIFCVLLCLFFIGIDLIASLVKGLFS